MRPLRKVGRQALVVSVLWRVLGWLLVLFVVACAVGGWGLPDDDPLFRIAAIGFAVFFVYIAVRFEMLLRSAGRARRED
ncbi:hypothetical protein F4553_001886 [Allocatelliglobosispora scoriae]|uniref:Uncharacterized protein n=1 Tax=Allocatelliglobosispora scoriae TaxID=643052 RepID=A0A841BHE4_9ACTN|nr:hypothetical protein [Allocatelliglobosispora scoriae]MBB5868507.1 hypothetical protein [Allocatelliglobosispora scoriae]